VLPLPVSVGDVRPMLIGLSYNQSRSKPIAVVIM